MVREVGSVMRYRMLDMLCNGMSGELAHGY